VSATDVRPNQREHILDVSLRLMSERGATGMSMRQLANACDLQVAAIYHYFPSKDALLAAVVAERQYGSRLEDPLPVDPDAPPAERLTDVFVRVFEGALSEQSIWRLLIGEAMRGESTVLPVGQDLIALLGPAAVTWVSAAVPEVSNPEDLAQLVVGQLLTGFIRTVFEPDVPTRTIALQVAAPLAALVSD
jgi:AcrR family transcriptional regulator